MLAARIPSRQLGPYAVVRDVASAPGARWAKATTRSGDKRLLQLATFRAPRTRSEDFEERYAIKLACFATEQLRSDPEIPLVGGGLECDPHDGTFVLFWAFPWDEDYERLGAATNFIGSAQRLLQVAAELLERMVARHEAGRLEPLLSEGSILVRQRQPATIAGAPISIRGEWLSRDMKRARLAPEEEYCPSAAGDLWRLGKALEALALPISMVPDEVEELIASLCSRDPLDRPESAEAALALTQELAASIADRPQFPVPALRFRSFAGEKTQDYMTIAETIIHRGERDTLVDFLD